MHEFSVWAPDAKRVTLEVDGARVAMEQAEHGWWRVSVLQAGHGSNYGFLLDDNPKVFPDPRSGWQPDGVHGLSRVYDTSRFKWTADDFRAPPLADAILYELHIGTFTPEGTFDAAIGRLEYLRELGVTHVEIMPVNSFEGSRGWGYDGVTLYAPHESYGGPAALQRLVDACHAHGLAAMLDVVYNHLGPAGNYAPQFGPYLDPKHSTPWSSAINLEDAGSTGVRKFLIDNALQWLRDYHFDGLRLDAVHSLVDRSAVHVLEQLREKVDGLSAETGRSYTLIAESDANDPRLVTPIDGGGLGMDAQWSDDFHHALFALLTGERGGYYADFGSLAQLAKALTCVFVYDGQFSEYRGRVQGRPVVGLRADKFLGYIQNHDQIGNRAFGGRVGHVAGLRKAKMAAAIVLMAPFVPMLFEGEEFAASTPFQYFTDFTDEELRKAVSEGRRQEHAPPGVDWQDVPDPEDPQTLERSKLRWDELQQPEHAEMLAWYRALIKLRRERGELRDTELSHVHVSFKEEERWLRMVRGRTTVLCNFCKDPLSLEMLGPKRILLTSDDAVELTDNAVRVPGESVAIVVAE
jgi:maltooligosyltrehalose trehalohydrolase